MFCNLERGVGYGLVVKILLCATSVIQQVRVSGLKESISKTPQATIMSGILVPCFVVWGHANDPPHLVGLVIQPALF